MSIGVKISSAIHKFLWLCAYNRVSTNIYEWILWNQVKNDKIPEHIGVILDGNRRWAVSKGLTTLHGHLEGAKKAEKLIEWCLETGKIRTATLYIFSTENFNRLDEEVEKIMSVIESYLKMLKEDKRIHGNQTRVKIIGRTEILPHSLQTAIKELEESTEKYSKYYLNLAIAYGGRAEIVDALKKIATDVKAGRLAPNDLDEKVVEEHLYTHFLPNPHPDMIIRTSGEERLSNFLLWQSAYSELCFLDVYWPGFRKIDLLRAIRLYQQRQRRYGG